MYGTGIILYSLIPLGILAAIVFFIVWVVKKTSGGHHTTATDWKKLLVGSAILIILPFFIGFFTSAIFDQLVKTESFVMMVTLALIFIIMGIIMMRNQTISYSLIGGSIISLVYSVGLNYNTVDSKVMVVFVGIALALLIIIAFKKFQEKEAA